MKKLTRDKLTPDSNLVGKVEVQYRGAGYAKTVDGDETGFHLDESV